MKKLYVGNLPWSAAEADLEALFSAHGEVHSCAIISDRDTGRSRGFGFIEMEDAGADSATSELNGQDFHGRPLTVNEARERPRRGGGGGGGDRW